MKLFRSNPYRPLFRGNPRSPLRPPSRTPLPSGNSKKIVSFLTASLHRPESRTTLGGGERFQSFFPLRTAPSEEGSGRGRSPSYASSKAFAEIKGLEKTARVQMERGKYDDAKSTLLYLIQKETDEKNSPHPSTLCSFGVVARMLGEYDNAEKAFTWSLRLSPHGRTACEYGILLRELGRLDDSLAALDRAIQLEHATQGRSFCEKGITLRELGRPQEALEALRKAHYLNVQHQVWYPPVEVMIIELETKRDHLESAIQQLSQIMQAVESGGFPYQGAHIALIKMYLGAQRINDAFKVIDSLLSKGAVLEETTRTALEKFRDQDQKERGNRESEIYQTLLTEQRRQEAILRGLSAHRAKALGNIYRGRITDPNRHH